ncbi:MAG: hypothetical protein V3R52_02295 [Candidatus Neomarinimicrobiota bacterium]
MKKIILTLAIMFAYSCNSSSSDPDAYIEWTGGQTFSYSYSGGVLSGGTWSNKFEAVDGSGDVTLKVYVNGSKKETKTVTVEEGLVYKISVSLSTGNCGNSNSATVELKSSSAESPRQLNIDCSNIGVGSINVSEI